MKYDFKDPIYRSFLMGIGYTEEQIELLIENICEVGFISIKHDGLTLTLYKKCLISIPVFDPDRWNPFPDIQPPRIDEFLVTIREPDGSTFVTCADWRGDEWDYIDEDDQVLAFRQKMQPYQPEVKE